MTERSAHHKGGNSRRHLLLGAFALGGGYAALRYGLPAIMDRVSGLAEATPLEKPAGFRAMPLGPISQGLDPLVGLNTAEVTGHGQDRLEGRLCAALFGRQGVPDGVVPIASFSDYSCPFCRVLTPRLQKLAESSPDVLMIKWHELPLLGPASTESARAALAAGFQGKYVETHARLIRAAFHPTEPYLRALAADLDLDAERLLADMQSAAVTEALLDSRALAGLLGVIGTPAMVIGRTLVQGEVSKVELDKLIQRERADGPIPGCHI